MRAVHSTLFLSVVLAVCGGIACAPQVAKISSRHPDLFEKDTDQMQGHGRLPGEQGRPPELFVRKQNIAIRKAERANETGSLFNPDDERNYLFASSGPQGVGHFLNIAVVPNRSSKPKGPGGPGAKGPASGAAKDQSDAAGKQETAAEEELLKALPDLTPAEKGDPSLIKDFKMKIVHRFDNGDVLAMATRRSIIDGRGNEINVQTRIPYERLASGETLTTDDLLDVRYIESAEGELVERHSSGWEDEYSLRMSGFSEAKSKIAMELDDKRRQLDDVKGKVETQVKALAEERKQVAKQREDLQKKSEESQTKVAKLEDQVKEQQDKIEEQDQAIKELTPEEKPGDQKDGSDD